jgi:hypothetical protein
VVEPLLTVTVNPLEPSQFEKSFPLGSISTALGEFCTFTVCEADAVHPFDAVTVSVTVNDELPMPFATKRCEAF